LGKQETVDESLECFFGPCRKRPQAAPLKESEKPATETCLFNRPKQKHSGGGLSVSFRPIWLHFLFRFEEIDMTNHLTSEPADYAASTNVICFVTKVYLWEHRYRAHARKIILTLQGFE
jgi:hypothetical protein